MLTFPPKIDPSWTALSSGAPSPFSCSRARGTLLCNIFLQKRWKHCCCCSRAEAAFCLGKWDSAEQQMAEEGSSHLGLNPAATPSSQTCLPILLPFCQNVVVSWNKFLLKQNIMSDIAYVKSQVLLLTTQWGLDKAKHCNDQTWTSKHLNI